MSHATPTLTVSRRIAEVRKLRFQLMQLTHRIPARNAEAMIYARLLAMIADRIIFDLEAETESVVDPATT